MDANLETLQTIALWVFLASVILLLPALVFTLSAKQKRQEQEWLPEPIAKGLYQKIEIQKIVFGSLFTTILFADGGSCTVVDILEQDLPVPGTYIEIYKTKSGNHFRIETPVPPSSCL